ncbi:oxidoreductase [Sulfitobacter sp. SK012]|uniref:oxidoreductase n=1 Tax=Sulfitobacter sp. SK012 TaxID=1389005 RepID=UPI000E0C7339|nr:oxidoreductase [Sulfitobacter sp. SK012]AXI47691.1 oxidoreductase [Sulfitobacter sp. SK012]
MAILDQVPLQSGFHAKSTASEVMKGINLTGKTAIVTGGYSGLGLETVRALASKGAKVIVPVRSEAKAKEALADIAGDITTAPIDLADLGSVNSFAASMQNTLPQLDLLINNAGVMASPESKVGPGWESQFGICHMGHFALTQGLFSLLEKADAPRVVALSSTAHKMSDIRWDDINFEHSPYEKWPAYGQAKTANALFANALSRRLKDAGGLAFSVHPGGIFTPLQRHLPKEEMIAIGWLNEDGEPSELAKAGFKTPEQGASTTLWAATSPKLIGMPGVYCEDADIAAMTDPDSPTVRYIGADAHICDDDSAERLWDLSVDWLKNT